MKNQKPSVAAHCLVLAGPLLALVFTLCVLIGDGGTRYLPAVLFLAVLWTFICALSGAMWRAYHGDWSGFSAYTLPEKDDDHFEWAARTGRYAWRRDYEEEGLFDEDHPISHDPIA